MLKDAAAAAAAAGVRYIKGFITRDDPATDDNQRFIRYMKYNYLTSLKKKLPKSLLDKSWPPSPSSLREVCSTDVCLAVLLLLLLLLLGGRLSVCLSACVFIASMPTTISYLSFPLCIVSLGLFFVTFSAFVLWKRHTHTRTPF